MMAENKPDIWVLSIHDMAPQGFLAFDIKEILACLGPAVRDYSWLVTELDCTGAEAQQLCEEVARAPGAGVVLPGEELLTASAKFSQTIDATLIGIPKSVPDSGNLTNLSRVELFPEAPAEVVIRAVDSSFFEVMTKKPEHVRALKACFKDVRVEQIDKYFAATGPR